VGDGRGCARRGRLLLGGARTARDTADALPWFATGCALLDSDACADQAFYAYRAGVDDELTTMRAVTACREESGYGCWVAGVLYSDPARYEPGRVEEYFTRACRLGHGPGCTAVAGTLNENRLAEVYKSLRRACALRDGEGCQLYAELLGDWESTDGPLHYLALACEYGSADGCWMMMSLERGRGHEVEEGRYRSRACRLDPAYCRVKL
jgi:TPR repeat protein